MLKEVKVVFIDEFKQSFRNKRSLFLIAVLILTFFLMKIGKSILVVLYVIFEPFRLLPHSVLLPFYLSYIIIPLIAIVISHDSIAEETQRNHIRYLASKVSRTSIFLGKFLNNLFLSYLFILLLFGSSILINHPTRGFPTKEIALIVVQLIIFVTAIISIVMLCSTVCKTSSGALKVSLLVYTILVVMAMDIRIKAISLVYYYPLILKSLIPLLIFLVYSVICVALSLIIIERKDL